MLVRRQRLVRRRASHRERTEHAERIGRQAEHRGDVVRLSDQSAAPPAIAGGVVAFGSLTSAWDASVPVLWRWTNQYLLERGYGAGFAAFAVGLVGISQIPGRILFGVLAGRLAPEWPTALVFTLIALGIGLVVSVDATWAVVAGLVVLGMGNGMATLARATVIADLYGPADYGAIAGVAALTTTVARAAGPFAAAVYVAAAGYEALLWTLVAVSLVAAALANRAEAIALPRQRSRATSART